MKEGLQNAGAVSRLAEVKRLPDRHRFARALYRFAREPSYGWVFWERLRGLAGYDFEHWARIVYNEEWQRFLSQLPASSASALEVSPGIRTKWGEIGFRRYRIIQYPEFDISRESLAETFDIIIADQVFEHLRHPYQAARNIGRMLKDTGTFLVATPFLLKVHPDPHDFTRWTGEGMKAFLEDCGFVADVRSWGNRRAVKANLNKWCEYGWGRDLGNEPDFPVVVWAYAQRR